MEIFNNFSLICLVFGLFCAVVGIVGHVREMRDINRAAEIRRIEFPLGRRLIFQEDGKPLCYEDEL